MAEEDRHSRDRRYRTDGRVSYPQHRGQNSDQSPSPSRDPARKRRARSRDYDDERHGKADLRGRDKQRKNRWGEGYSDDSQHRRQRKLSKDRGLERSRSHSPQPFKRSKGPLPSQKDAFQHPEHAIIKTTSTAEKQKPNFATTGRLAAASNTVQKAGQSIVLKYHEPPEARKPSGAARWRMYVFKGEEIVDTVELAQQSCWLFGREAAVVDVLLEHPSTSKQHAIIQFRYTEVKNEFGDRKGRVKPYILDLESANGTTVNGDLIPNAQYVELRDKDVVQFGRSSREYIVQLAPAE